MFLNFISFTTLFKIKNNWIILKSFANDFVKIRIINQHRVTHSASLMKAAGTTERNVIFFHTVMHFSRPFDGAA